jgi:hypothetical protein
VREGGRGADAAAAAAAALPMGVPWGKEGADGGPEEEEMAGKLAEAVAVEGRTELLEEL